MTIIDANTFLMEQIKTVGDILPDLSLDGTLDTECSMVVFIPYTAAGDRRKVFLETVTSWVALGYKVVLVVNKHDEDAMPLRPDQQVIYYTTSSAPSSGVARVVCFLLAWLWSKLCPDFQGAFGDDRRIVDILGTADKLRDEVKSHLTNGAVIVSPLSQRGATYEPQAYFAAQVFFFNSETIEKIWATIVKNIYAVSAPVGGDYALTSALQDTYGNDAVRIAVSAKRLTSTSVTVGRKKKPIRSLVRNDKILRDRLDASARERISGAMVMNQLSSSQSSIAKYIWMQIEGKNESFSIQRTLKKYLVRNKLF